MHLPRHRCMQRCGRDAGGIRVVWHCCHERT